MCSFMDVLYETPRLLEVLPPATLKNLSATCRSLRTSFCAQVRVIGLSDPEEASKLSCVTWPQLVLVVCTDVNLRKSHFSADWEYMLGMVMDGACYSAVMLRSHSADSLSVVDLPSQHCVALADLADKHRHATTFMHLQGPLMGCSAVQILTQGRWSVLERLRVCQAPQLGVDSVSHLCNLQSLTDVTISDCCLDAAALMQLSTGWPLLERIQLNNNGLDANTISALPRDKWPDLFLLELGSNTLGAAGIQHLVSCSWPELMRLSLDHTGIDDHDLRFLLQGQWPALRELNLIGNNISAIGISHLVHGRWPYLRRIFLSPQSLGEEAYSLLGIAVEPTSRNIGQQHTALATNHPTAVFELCTYASSLPQFPSLDIVTANNVADVYTETYAVLHQQLLSYV